MLQREIDDAQSRSEAVEAWAGKPARKLVLEGSAKGAGETQEYRTDRSLQPLP